MNTQKTNLAHILWWKTEGDILLTSEVLEGYKVKQKKRGKKWPGSLDFPLKEGIYEKTLISSLWILTSHI
jgi:hypothetical protein